jgi:hypothetical protein
VTGEAIVVGGVCLWGIVQWYFRVGAWGRLIGRCGGIERGVESVTAEVEGVFAKDLLLGESV